MTTAIVLTHSEAKEMRDVLVQTLSSTEADLRERADQYQLSAAELAVLDRLEELDFLLGR